jgi:hypothetical protein
MPRAVKLLAGLCAVAVLALVLAGVTQRNSLAFTIGVAPALPVLELQPREVACQTPITVPAGGEFDRVALTLAGGQDGRVEILDADAGRELARGTLRGGDPDRSEQVIRFRRIGDDRRVAVCLRNLGTRKLTVYGNAEAAARYSAAIYKDTPQPVDMAVRFERGARSDLSLLGLSFDHASLFKFTWMGGWTFWLLTVLVVLAVPALLVRALRGALE